MVAANDPPDLEPGNVALGRIIGALGQAGIEVKTDGTLEEILAGILDAVQKLVGQKRKARTARRITRNTAPP